MLVPHPPEPTEPTTPIPEIRVSDVVRMCVSDSPTLACCNYSIYVNQEEVSKIPEVFSSF